MSTLEKGALSDVAVCQEQIVSFQKTIELYADSHSGPAKALIRQRRWEADPTLRAYMSEFDSQVLPDMKSKA